MLKKMILDATKKYLENKVVGWTDEGILYLARKIREAELNIPGRKQGATKWQLVWKWIVEEAGEEIIEHKQDIEALAVRVVDYLNETKLW